MSLVIYLDPPDQCEFTTYVCFHLHLPHKWVGRKCLLRLARKRELGQSCRLQKGKRQLCCKLLWVLNWQLFFWRCFTTSLVKVGMQMLRSWYTSKQDVPNRRFIPQIAWFVQIFGDSASQIIWLSVCQLIRWKSDLTDLQNCWLAEMLIRWTHEYFGHSFS